MTSTRNYADVESKASTFQVTPNSSESNQGGSFRTLRSLSALADELSRERGQYWRELQLESRENKVLLRKNTILTAELVSCEAKAKKAEAERLSVLRSLLKANACRRNPNTNDFLVNEVISLERANKQLSDLCERLAVKLVDEREKRHGLKKAVRERLWHFEGRGPTNSKALSVVNFSPIAIKVLQDRYN